jgi:hypothetical protein
MIQAREESQDPPVDVMHIQEEAPEKYGADNPEVVRMQEEIPEEAEKVKDSAMEMRPEKPEKELSDNVPMRKTIRRPRSPALRGMNVKVPILRRMPLKNYEGVVKVNVFF